MTPCHRLDTHPSVAANPARPNRFSAARREYFATATIDERPWRDSDAARRIKDNARIRYQRLRGYGDGNTARSSL